jgi:5,10-methylenetetrahydromethanopterin reductase
MLGTGTGVVATRHPAVLASAAALLQVLSKGRMSLSLGRGDSALAHVGVPPVPLAYFERSLVLVQAYLQGKGVSLEEAAAMMPTPAGFDHLAVSTAPENSRLKWLPDGFDKPELEVAATGPKVIQIAARHADRISFAVGAGVERLRWAIEVAREEMSKIGRDPATVRLGAQLLLFPHARLDVARRLAQGLVAGQGRFSILNKKVVGPVTDAQRKVLEKVADEYNMDTHGSGTSKQAQALDAEFIDDFALVGDPARCVDRLNEIIELGIDRLNLWTCCGTRGEVDESYRMAVTQVLPKVKSNIR